MRPVDDEVALSVAYSKLAALDLVVEGYEVERREHEVSSGFTRVTSIVVLRGGGHTGRGEDVSYAAPDHDDFPLDLPLTLGAGGSLGTFCARLGDLAGVGKGRLYARPPEGPAVSTEYRRWAFESAALDLALRQAGASLGEVLARPYRPVRFVVSTRLDIWPWLAFYPGLEFKLDPTSEWDRDFMREIAATDAVRVIDFKGYYQGTVVENPPDAALYAAAVAAFPDAIIEDAVIDDETTSALRGVEERLSWDAPIHSVADIEALPLPPRFLNIKPSRFGSLERLLAAIAYAEERGITLYGGGQFELGIGRDQIQALASLFYADAPNDVAPGGYNEPAPRAGLRASPLTPPAHPAGFSFSDG